MSIFTGGDNRLVMFCCLNSPERGAEFMHGRTYLHR
jgi:hypothetical protein